MLNIFDKIINEMYTKENVFSKFHLSLILYFLLLNKLIKPIGAKIITRPIAVIMWRKDRSVLYIISVVFSTPYIKELNK